ncbi:hypothetical protein C0J52_11343 [Blattella germanica]|nr:hypothetical protein C0J52_11343 [Blattella germanica]
MFYPENKRQPTEAEIQDELLQIVNEDAVAEVPNPPKMRATSKAIPPIDSRTTGNSHLPLGAIIDKNKWMRCRNKNCKSKTKFPKCSQRNRFLCFTAEIQCFSYFQIMCSFQLKMC